MKNVDATVDIASLLQNQAAVMEQINATVEELAATAELLLKDGEHFGITNSNDATVRHHKD